MGVFRKARSELSSMVQRPSTEIHSRSSRQIERDGGEDSESGPTDSSPLVSVVIPTYNRAEYLPRAIKSVRNQTLDEYEIVIVDDGSTDETRQTVDRYLSDTGRITYLSHDRNRGPAAARNTGLEVAEGKYVSFLDSDDELKPTYLERSVRKLETLPADYAAVYVALEVRRDGEYTGKFGVASVIPAMSLIDTIPLRLGRLGGLTVRKEALEEIGPFDERLQNVEDTDYWVRLLEWYTLVGIDEQLYVYHQHGEQITRDSQQLADALDLFFSKHHHRLTSKATAWCQLKLAHLHAANGQLPEAIARFRTVTEIQPWRLSAYYYTWLLKSAPTYYHEPVDVRAKLHDIKSKLESWFPGRKLLDGG